MSHQQNARREKSESWQMSMLKDSGVTWLSASLAHIPHHPLYTLKNQMMYYGGEFKPKIFLGRTSNTRGLFLMRGVVSRTFGVGPEKVFKMMAWQGGIKFVNYMWPECSQFLKWSFAGALAGAATTFIGCPSERAMVLANIQNRGFRAVFHNAGVKGLYHGAEATLYRDISFNMCLFTLRSYIMSWYEARWGEEPSHYMKVIWGLPASVTAGVIACPFDVVKARIQGKELKDYGPRRPLPLMLQIVRQEGVRYLFKGLLPRLIVVPLYMSVFITVNEELQKLLLGKRIIS